MDMLIKSQSNFAKLMTLGHINSEQGTTERLDSWRESSKRSEIIMYIEMAFALAGVFLLLAMAAWIWHMADLDLFSSIQRFQEMI